MIGTDKIAHCTICYGIAVTIGFASHWLIGLAVAWIIGIVKEVYDDWRGSGHDWWDVLADVVGGLVGAIVALII